MLLGYIGILLLQLLLSIDRQTDRQTGETGETGETGCVYGPGGDHAC